MADLRLPFLLMLAVLLSLVLASGLDRLGAYFAPRADLVSYFQADGTTLHLHVFRARGMRPDTGFPALMLFHGGAWQLGSPSQFHPQCRHFARRGITCLSVEYRLGARHGTDVRAAMADAARALAHVREHAASLGIDPARIVVGGGSAGGHLAAILGLAMGPDGTSKTVRPAAMVLYNPMLDLSPGHPDHERVADFWHQVSPMHHVDHAVPPTLVLSGTADPEVPVATVQAFCEAVRAKGGRCDLALYEGAAHGFFNPGAADRHFFKATNERVESFLASLPR